MLKKKKYFFGCLFLCSHNVINCFSLVGLFPFLPVLAFTSLISSSGLIGFTCDQFPSSMWTTVTELSLDLNWIPSPVLPDCELKVNTPFCFIVIVGIVKFCYFFRPFWSFFWAWIPGFECLVGASEKGVAGFMAFVLIMQNSRLHHISCSFLCIYSCTCSLEHFSDYPSDFIIFIIIVFIIGSLFSIFILSH